MNSIKTKILTLFLCATMAFSAVGFSACGNSELEAKLAELQAQIDTQQTQIISLQEQNEELQETTALQAGQITGLEQENEELQASVAEQQTQIADLEDSTEQQSLQFASLEQKNDMLENKTKQQSSQIIDLQEEINEKTEQIFNLQDLLYQQSSQITELQQENQISYNSASGVMLYEQNDYEMVKVERLLAVSSLHHTLLHFNHENENVVFEITVGDGELNREQYLMCSPGASCLWSPYENGQDVSKEIDDVFIDIIIKLDNKYIGYAVVKIVSSGAGYVAIVVKCVTFPQIDGEDQFVASYQVSAAITAAKGLA